MNAAVFTKGEWSLPHFAKPDVDCSCGFVLSEQRFGAICTVHCSGDGDDIFKHGDNPKFKEAVANAHLIHAAPRMYRALTALNKAARPMNWEDDKEAAAAWRKLDAALAKARGDA